jgi:hypothetical protein
MAREKNIVMIRAIVRIRIPIDMGL